MGSEKKSGKGSIITIVILVILVIALLGYIGYEKFLSKDTTSTTEEISKNITKNETENTSYNTDNTTNNEINDNQSLKFQYYASKQQEDSSNSYRYSITLGESNDNNGFFSINLLNQFEGPVASGYYRIENGKLILSFGPYTADNNFSIEEGIFIMMNATLVDDPNQEIAPNHKAYILDYNDDELQIGDYKLYRVK